MNPADLATTAHQLEQSARSAHHRAGLAFAAHEDDLAVTLYDEADDLWRALRVVQADLMLLRRDVPSGSASA